MIKALLMLAVATMIPFTVSADFYQVNQHYEAGEYQKSFPQLLLLAQQGNASAQVALAQSYAKGYGTPADYNQAFAWVMMAMDNQTETANKLYLDYRGKVKSRRNAKTLYKQLKSKYGIEALNISLLPIMNSNSQSLTKPAITIDTPQPEYPVAIYEKKANIWTIAQFDVNENGVTQNVNILASYPDNNIDAVVIKAINDWRFKSAIDAQNNPVRHDNQVQLFELFEESGHFAGSKVHLDILTKANQGSAQHQYLYAKLVDSNLVVSKTSALQWLINSAVNGYGKAQFELYQCLTFDGRCKADRVKALKWLKIANRRDEIKTKMLMAKAYLNPDNPLLPFSPPKALTLLEGLIATEYLPVLSLYAKLLATSEVKTIKDTQKAIKYARQAMALDNDNPQLLAVLAIAYYDLDKAGKGQDFLMQAIKEAEYRRWPIDYYVNLLEDYQRATLLVDEVVSP
jgi:TPR repeat protein